MPRILCVKCQVEFRPEKNGVYVKEMMHHDQDVYKIWDTDLWQCPCCNFQVVSGFANYPIAEHFQATFPRILQTVNESGCVYTNRERVNPLCKH